jgi:hypothetical protein
MSKGTPRKKKRLGSFGKLRLALSAADDFAEDLVQNHDRSLSRIDVDDEVGAIVLEQRLGFVLVGDETLADDLLVGVIEAIVLDGAALEALHELVTIGAAQMENLPHVDEWLEELCLGDIARNAVEYEKIDVRAELMSFHAVLNAYAPKLDCDFVRDELAFTGVLDESLAEGGAGIDGAKDITAGAVKKAWNRTERDTLSSLAASRCTKDQISSIFAGGHPPDIRQTNDKKQPTKEI